MLEKAQERVARRRTHNVQLVQMDAAALDFPDDSFDIVYAPYLISVVPDPVQVAREMHRVCRAGGRIIFLNHFLSSNRLLSQRGTADLAADHPYRLQIGPRPAGVSRSDEPAPDLDREGDRSEDVVAGVVSKGLALPGQPRTQNPQRS